MKKVLGLLAVVALLVGLMAVAAAAAAPGDGIPDYAGHQSGNAWGFVDDDADGINDRFVDVDGDGVCDNFVDEDGDGVNDLRGTRGPGFGPNGSGTCSGDGFVDEDGDGVCDNAGGGLMLGRGMRHGQNR